MGRRRFAGICLAGAVAGLPKAAHVGADAPSGSFTRYPRVRLTTPTGEPLRAGGLDPEEEYLFFYPFVSTPCLLLDLGRPVAPVEVVARERGAYAWGGGAGPGRSVVAFTAICPHQRSHPERAFSPIGYHRTGEKAAVVGGRDRMIVCCAHGSAFDPAAGGRVEQAPAELPLAAVPLHWDREHDRFFAEGIFGPDSFDQFFREFRGRSRALVEGSSAVMRLRDYSAAVARC